MLKERIETQVQWQEQPPSGLLIYSERDFQQSQVEHLMVFRRDSRTLEMLLSPDQCPQHAQDWHQDGDGWPRWRVYEEHPGRSGCLPPMLPPALCFVHEGSAWLCRPEMFASLYLGWPGQPGQPGQLEVKCGLPPGQSQGVLC